MRKVDLSNILKGYDPPDITPLYRIEVQVGKGPKTGVKAGAIVVFRLNSVELDFSDALKLKGGAEQQQAAAMQEEINKQTETMHIDPIYFKETDGRWLPWAMHKAFELFDRYGGVASVALKCPKLKISVVRSAKAVRAGRSNPLKLFPVIRDLDALLDGNYAYDPWTKTIRRGEINPEKGGR